MNTRTSPSADIRGAAFSLMGRPDGDCTARAVLDADAAGTGADR